MTLRLLNFKMIIKVHQNITLSLTSRIYLPTKVMATESTCHKKDWGTVVKSFSIPWSYLPSSCLVLSIARLRYCITTPNPSTPLHAAVSSLLNPSINSDFWLDAFRASSSCDWVSSRRDCSAVTALLVAIALDTAEHKQDEREWHNLSIKCWLENAHEKCDVLSSDHQFTSFKL